MDWITTGVVFLFFWILIGQYAYREAKGEGRTVPKLRGIFWGVFGIVGAVSYLIYVREREPNQIAWLGFSILLFTMWTVGFLGLWGLNSGFHLWAGLFAGVFILYWRFDINPSGSGTMSAAK